MPWSCVRGARGRVGGVGAGAGFCVFPVSPFLPCVSRAVCGGPSRPGVPYPRSLIRHSMRSVRSAGSVRLPFWSSPRVLGVCAQSRSGGVRAQPPTWVGVARAPRGVPMLGAGRAVPRGSCPSACSASVPCTVWLAWWGGRPGPVPALPGWGCVPSFGRALGGCGRGCGCGGCGCVDPSPTPQRALLRAGFSRCGGGTRAPGGGASCLGLGRPGSGALPPLTARLFGRAAGAHHPLAVGAGGAGVWIRHQPHSARSCELALRAVGAARGRPGGAPLAWVWGVRGRALSHPRPPVLWGVRPGPTTHWLWVRGLRAWGPITNPTARAYASWLCALWGQLEGTRGRRLLPGCGASGVGRCPTPDRPSSGACGRGPLPTGCGCGGCGREDPSLTPQPALMRAGFARCAGGSRAPGGGAPLAWLFGARGQALSNPRPPVLWGPRPGPATHWLWVRGVRA